MQKFFKYLHFFSLRGMNFGGGSDYKSSGEFYVLNYVAGKVFAGGQKAVIIDGGANSGGYALAAEKIFGSLTSGFIIYSFEPSRKTFEKLLVNTKGKNIKPINMALGETEAIAVLYSNTETSELASLYPRQLEHIGSTMGIKQDIKVTALDSFCEREKITKIDFLKLDLEGHELSAFLGAKSLMENGAIRFIQFEFGGANIDSRTFFRDFYNLLNPRYKIYRIIKNGLEPVLKYSEWEEIFVTSNFFAELK